MVSPEALIMIWQFDRFMDRKSRTVKEIYRLLSYDLFYLFSVESKNWFKIAVMYVQSYSVCMNGNFVPELRFLLVFKKYCSKKCLHLKIVDIFHKYFIYNWIFILIKFVAERIKLQHIIDYYTVETNVNPQTQQSQKEEEVQIY